MSRPDIANAVREVAQHFHNASRNYWNAVRRILKYLKHTRPKGINYKKGDSLILKVDFDCDFARREEDRRSESGVVVMRAGATVPWFQRTPRCVKLPTTESEYISMGDRAKQRLLILFAVSFVHGAKHAEKCGSGFPGQSCGAFKLANNPRSFADRGTSMFFIIFFGKWPKKDDRDRTLRI